MEENKVAQKGEWNFVVAQSFVRDKLLSVGARLLFIIIKSYAGPNCDRPFPQLQTLAGFMGRNRQTVQEYLRELEATGWLVRDKIKIKGKFHSTRYELVTENKTTDRFPRCGKKPLRKNMASKTDQHTKEEEEPASSFKKSKASPKLPNSREFDEPEKEKLLPVLERWREVYEIVLGSPYVESRKDMEALSHLLHRWPDADQLAGVIESAFLLVGHPKAWTCNNRMETIDAFAVNIAKIMGEVKKHAVLPEAQHRMELARRERLWINNHKMAMEWLRKKFGAQAILESFVPMAVVNYLMGDDDLGEVPPYFRCLFSHENPNVTLNHGYAAGEELDDANMEGFVEFLKFHGWWMDLSAYERGR